MERVHHEIEEVYRPTIRTPKEEADPLGRARIFVEVDAGTGQGVHVTVDLKITVRPRMASSFSHVAGELETSSAKLSDQHPSDQQPDDPGKGPYIIGLFGKPIPVSRL